MQDNDIEMYSVHNEEKYVADERFIRTLKKKAYNYMTSISKRLFIDKLANVVNKNNNICHSTSKMKPADIKWKTYINFN